MDEERLHGLRLAASIHDVGKIQVPAEILSKPGHLNAIEFSLIKLHPRVGYEILRDIQLPWPIAGIILQHHEALDGSGYPSQLKGDEILMETRVLTVADVVEAMSSHRPYRPALGMEPALAEIRRYRGIRHDADVVERACVSSPRSASRLISRAHSSAADTAQKKPAMRPARKNKDPQPAELYCACLHSSAASHYSCSISPTFRQRTSR